MHFQAYLLEGLQRWNADRATNAVSNAVTEPESYSGVLCQVVNELSEDVLGKAIRPDVQKVGIYTGTLLFSNTLPLQDCYLTEVSCF